MPVFAYRALDLKGQESAGTLTADSRASAVEQVIQRGFTPVLVQEHSAGPVTVRKVAPAAARASQAQVDSFTLELANLLSAGIPLSRGLTIIMRETTSPSARALWTAIHDDVVGGTSLADALAKYPRTFPKVYVAMVRAGETGGFLDSVLNQIAEFQTREQDLKGKVKAAMVYPLVLATLAVGVLIFLLTYFIPKFTLIFKDFGSSLPWLTRMIVAASEIVLHKGVFVLIGGVLLFIAIKRTLETEAGRRLVEKIALHTPILGHIVARFALIRFSRMLGTLLGSGVGLISALKVAKEAIGNQILSDTVATAIEEVQHGASLSKSLGATERLFPASVTEMIAVAEETGRLDKELMRMSVAFESDLDRRLRMLVALAEPLLLFVMAAVIGTVVVGMLMPLFQLQDLVK
ncbi:MAG TPA: type II secretion system F family protein [Planctomycetota bacterium]|nr:type II secretion system F family protein [Planctomycetota bacterium]